MIPAKEQTEMKEEKKLPFFPVKRLEVRASYGDTR